MIEQAVRQAIAEAPISSLQRMRLNMIMRNPFLRKRKEALIANVTEHLQAKQAINVVDSESGQVVEAAIEWIMIINLIIQYLPQIIELFSRFGNRNG